MEAFMAAACYVKRRRFATFESVATTFRLGQFRLSEGPIGGYQE
jgi:hypothetical protein